MYTLDSDEFRHSPPEFILQHMLSTKAYIPNKPAVAEERPRSHGGQSTCKQIGQGQCGTVYTISGTDMVVKLPNGPEKYDELWRDCYIHKCVEEAFRNVPLALRGEINLPTIRAWVDPTTKPFWVDYTGAFGDGESSYGLLSDRIFPVPQPVGVAIVDTFCPHLKDNKAKQQEFLDRPENKDCLIRLYLGRRGIDRTKTTPHNVKLRNFPLHVDEMEHLKLDTAFYARIMAQT